MKTEVKVLLGAIFFLVVIIIINLLISNNVGGISNKNKPSLSANNSPIKILSSNMENDADGNYFILGIAQNIGTTKLNYSEIDANFYDRAGILMTKSLDKIQNLGANETWNFKIIYPGVEAYNLGSYNLSIGDTW